MMKNLFSRAMGSCVCGVLPAVLAGCFQTPKWETSRTVGEPGVVTGGGLYSEEITECCSGDDASAGTGAGGGGTNGTGTGVGAGNVNVNVNGDNNVTNVNVEVTSGYGYVGYHHPVYYYGPYAYSQPYYGYGPYPYYWAPSVPAVRVSETVTACSGDGIQDAPKSQGQLVAQPGTSLVQAYRALAGARISSLEILGTSKSAGGTRLDVYRGGSAPGEGDLIARVHRPDRVNEGESLVFDFPDLPAIEKGDSVFVVVSNAYELVSIGGSKAKRSPDLLEADGLWVEIGDRIVKEKSYREIAAVLRFEADCHEESDTVAGL